MGIYVLYMKMLNNNYLSSSLIRIVGYGIAVSHVEEVFCKFEVRKVLEWKATVWRRFARVLMEADYFYK